MEGVKFGNEEAHQGTTGGHNLHDESNHNGQRLIDFESSRNLVIKSTCFHHKRVHKGIWTSPGGTTFNQIDGYQTSST